MITSDNLYLLDTNILVYAADVMSPFNSACQEVRAKGLNEEILICITPQVLLEFFAVVTSPKKVTSPMEPYRAIEEMQKYLEADEIIKIYPNNFTLPKVIELSRQYNIKSNEIFDFQIVATMLSNNVTCIYTYDVNHFSRFDFLRVFSP